MSIGKILIKGLNKLVDFIFLLLLMLMLFLCCYSLWDSGIVYHTADASNYEVFKPTKDDSLSFGQLQAINSEVFAWITVNDTKIDYPVAQSAKTESDKYVNTGIKCDYSLSGAIFLDSGNDPHFSDFNSIIYGHHMEQGEMFGDLDKFRDQSFFDSHKYGNLYYDGKDHGLEFFAYLDADAYDFSIYAPKIEGEEQQQTYLNNLLSKAKYTRDLGVTIKDHIVLLSTCASETTNGRYILVAKITDTLHPQEKVVKKVVTGNGVDVTAAVTWMSKVPVLAWLLLLFIVLLLLLLLVTKLHRKHAYEKESGYENHEQSKRNK